MGGAVWPIWSAPARLQTLALPGKLGWAQAASGWLPRRSGREREEERGEPGAGAIGLQVSAALCRMEMLPVFLQGHDSLRSQGLGLSLSACALAQVWCLMGGGGLFTRPPSLSSAKRPTRAAPATAGPFCRS